MVPINFDRDISKFLPQHSIEEYQPVIADKPPIEELAEFLEFQLPRKWAPQFNELPLGLHRKRGLSPKLQFSFMGPKFSVSTDTVLSFFMQNFYCFLYSA